MRVVFVNRIAWPDEGATAIYLTDVAEGLARAGHEVHVISGEAGYREGASRTAPATEHEGVRYHRVPGERGTGIWRRAWASRAFLARASRVLAALPAPDVVVPLTDPPFLDAAIGRAARARGARVVVWWMDAYPDVIVASGVVGERSPWNRILRARMGRALRSADAVVVLGKAMRRPVLSHDVDPARIRVIENWAPREVEGAPWAHPKPTDVTTLLYSGNLGRAHDLSLLAEVAKKAPPGPPIRIEFQAAGARLEETRALFHAAQVPVVWREPVPREALGDSLREASWHVVSVRPGFERLLVPSKVYAPLALGRPLLVLGPATSEPARIVRRLGRGVVWSTPEEAARGWSALSSDPRGAASASPWRRRDEGIAAWRGLLEEVARRRGGSK